MPTIILLAWDIPSPYGGLSKENRHGDEEKQTYSNNTVRKNLILSCSPWIKNNLIVNLVRSNNILFLGRMSINFLYLSSKVSLFGLKHESK